MLRFRLAAVVLLAALTASAADRPEPSDDKILHEGPIQGEVVFKNKFGTRQKWTGTIQFVARDAIYMRRDRSNDVTVLETAINTVEYAIGKKDGKKLYWEWDAAKKEIKGSIAPVNTPVIPVTTADPKGEPKYLFFSLERLQDRIDQAISQADTGLLKYLADRAEVVREHAEKERFDPRLVRLYVELTDYIKKQAALEKERREFLEQHLEKVELNEIKDKEAALRAEMVKAQGLGEYFRGAFPRVNVYLGRGWWGPRAYATASYDFGGAMAGVATIIRGQQQYELERLRIAFAKKLLDRDKEKRLDELGERQEVLKKDRLKHIADVGAELYGLPKSKDSLETRERAADLQSKSDFRSLLEVLEARASTERQGDEQANPFTLLDSYHTASQLTERSRAAQSEKLFDLAVKAVDAAKYVPPGRLYDPDRADVLKTAGGLACMAAMLDSPNDTWRCACSPRAAYAVRLLERAKSLNLDQSGQMREQLAVAYALAGRPSEAIRLAEEIRGTRKGSVPFLITLARLLALNDRAKDGLDVIQDAVTQGYTDILFLRNNEDFGALKAESGRYEAYTKPQFLVEHVVPKALGKNVQMHRFEITNKSPFPVSDVRILVKVDLRGGKKLSFPLTMRELAKGDRAEITDTFSDHPSRIYQVTVTIDTDQGKIEVKQPTRK
jgi:hypothetical protein